MKYREEKEVFEKIDELFEFRKLKDLYALYPIKGDFYSRLRKLQFSIYMLDAFLEANWNLDPALARVHWEKMNQHLIEFLNNEKTASKWFAEIRKYEKIESNCRNQKWPTKVEFESFYTTKSCDVRLMRKLIYHSSPDIESIWKEKSWMYFDQITEVHDDIEDLREDLPTYNANRFLISILRKGFPKTIKAYKKGLGEMEKKAKKFFSVYGDEDPHMQVLEITLRQLSSTNTLLLNFEKTFDVSLLSESKLLLHMK